MAEEQTMPPRRRRGRPPGSGTGTRSATGTRRRRTATPELVETLNTMVAQLIKENRQLKRQIDKLTTRGTAAAAGTVERGLRSMQRRLQRAVETTSGSKARRRRSPAAAAPVRRRRRASPGGSTSETS